MNPQIDSTLKNVRTAAVVTGSYVAGTDIAPSGSFNPRNYNQLVIYWTVTLGSLTSAELKIQFSPDGSTFYQETASTLSPTQSTDGVIEHTVTATGNYRIAIPIADEQIRISVKGTGTVTNSSVGVQAFLVKNYA